MKRWARARARVRVRARVRASVRARVRARVRASVRVTREGLHAGRPPMHGAEEGQCGAARRVRSGEELRRRLPEAGDLRRVRARARA